MKRPLVLVVEDDQDIRDSLVEILEDEGYLVASASDGQEAIDYLSARELPGLILLDVMMPRLNGNAFRQAQLANPTWAQIPTAILTADGNIQSKAKELGVTMAIRKPVKIDDLLRLVVQCLGLGPRPLSI